MNLKQDWLASFLAVAALAAGLVVVVRVLRNSEVRDGISWALGTWARPPDADAVWEQRATARR
jgi:hypothetical protein